MLAFLTQFSNMQFFNLAGPSGPRDGWLFIDIPSPVDTLNNNRRVRKIKLGDYSYPPLAYSVKTPPRSFEFLDVYIYPLPAEVADGLTDKLFYFFYGKRIFSKEIIRFS